MKRKLIKQAGQALTITLPIDWIRKNGLKAGNEIDLEISEKNLILSSNKKTVGGSVKINAFNFPPRLKYIYTNAMYAKGIDQIEIEAEKNYYPDLSQNIGYAVVSQKGNNFTIRDVGGISSENLDEIFKRVFQMIIEFYDSAIENIFSSTKESYEKITRMDSEINKFVLFLQRSIMKQSYPDLSAAKILFAYSFSLEKIGDEILRIWRTSIQKKVVKNTKVKEIVLLSRKALEKSFEIYYQSNIDKINEIINIREDIRKKSSGLFNISPETTEFLMHAIKIAEDSFDLTHLALIRRLKTE